MINKFKLIVLGIIDVITSILALVMTVIFFWVPSSTGFGKTIERIIKFLKKFATGIGGEEKPSA